MTTSTVNVYASLQPARRSYCPSRSATGHHALAAITDERAVGTKFDALGQRPVTLGEDRERNAVDATCFTGLGLVVDARGPGTTDWRYRLKAFFNEPLIDLVEVILGDVLSFTGGHGPHAKAP